MSNFSRSTDYLEFIATTNTVPSVVQFTGTVFAVGGLTTNQVSSNSAHPWYDLIINNGALLAYELIVVVAFITILMYLRRRKRSLE